MNIEHATNQAGEPIILQRSEDSTSYIIFHGLRIPFSHEGVAILAFEQLQYTTEVEQVQVSKPLFTPEEMAQYVYLDRAQQIEMEYKAGLAGYLIMLSDPTTAWLEPMTTEEIAKFEATHVGNLIQQALDQPTVATAYYAELLSKIEVEKDSLSRSMMMADIEEMNDQAKSLGYAFHVEAGRVSLVPLKGVQA